MQKVFRISLAAALLSARLSGSADASYLPEDFEQIESMVEAGNWVALRGYLNANPQVLECNDDLAVELKRFLQDASGLYAALTFEDSMFPNMGLRDTVPDDCIVVASADEPASVDDASPGSVAPVTSRAASSRGAAVGAPLGNAAAAPSIY